ncbi:MAG: hypothetical protein U0599_26845 [Vicinamibacteria bacterium]
MKRDIEQLLREAPLRPPPAGLEDRVEAAFERAAAVEGRWYARPVPLWACALFVALAAAAGYQARREPPPRIVYVMPVSPDLARVLTGASEPRPVDFPGQVRVSVTKRNDEEY